MSNLLRFENPEKSSFMAFNLSKFDQNILKAKVHSFDLIQDNNLNLELFVKRDDLIHNEISGNKWRKLKWNLIKACGNNCDFVATYGGAYSNHLLATASLGAELNIKTKGFVRGHELNSNSNPILSRCKELKMELFFLPRDSYDLVKYSNRIEDKGQELIWHIPEGGANSEGVLGCKEIMGETDNNYDYIFIAQGTTTTSLGILATMNPCTILVVVPVLKGFDSIHEMKKLANQYKLYFDESKIEVLDQYHFGGYAKTDQRLDQFISEFNQLGAFIIESTYTGKVLYALHEFVTNNKLDNKKVLFVHTGGLYIG